LALARALLYSGAVVHTHGATRATHHVHHAGRSAEIAITRGDEGEGAKLAKLCEDPSITTAARDAAAVAAGCYLTAALQQLALAATFGGEPRFLARGGIVAEVLERATLPFLAVSGCHDVGIPSIHCNPEYKTAMGTA
jgi:hypothetical protein